MKGRILIENSTNELFLVEEVIRMPSYRLNPINDFSFHPITVLKEDVEKNFSEMEIPEDLIQHLKTLAEHYERENFRTTGIEDFLDWLSAKTKEPGNASNT